MDGHEKLVCKTIDLKKNLGSKDRRIYLQSDPFEPIVIPLSFIHALLPLKERFWVEHCIVSD